MYAYERLKSIKDIYEHFIFVHLLPEKKKKKLCFPCDRPCIDENVIFRLRCLAVLYVYCILYLFIFGNYIILLYYSRGGDEKNENVFS